MQRWKLCWTSIEPRISVAEDLLYRGCRKLFHCTAKLQVRTWAALKDFLSDWSTKAGFYSTATKLFFNVNLQSAIIRKIFFLKNRKKVYLTYSRYVIMEVSNSFYAVLFPLRHQSLLISLPIETSKEVQWSKGWPVIESSKSPNIFSHLPLVPTLISISVVSVSGGQDNI